VIVAITFILAYNIGLSDCVYSNMKSDNIDFDVLFEHRDGFAAVYAKLCFYAITVIKKRSSLTRNGLKVAELDAKELVAHALSRLVELESFDDGEAVYCQLRRFIDDYVHTLQKKTTEPVLVPINTGNYEEDSGILPELEDINGGIPSDDAERREENEINRGIIKSLKSRYPLGSLEQRYIDLILEGWSERQELSELLDIEPSTYDALYKRVGRAAIAAKQEFLRRMAI